MTKLIAPYGDLTDDGFMQLDFTLPIACDDVAREAAKALAQKMGLDAVQVATMEPVTSSHTFFVVVGTCKHKVDLDSIHVPKLDFKPLKMDAVDALIREKIGRKLKVYGCNTGADAHTVGIDAIMNMKGYLGDYGLERYKMLDAKNLGSQVDNNELVQIIGKDKPDVVLISKVITQRDIHLQDLKELMDLVGQNQLKQNRLFIVGGPRITNKEAVELGYDAGFSTGTTASGVASYFVQEWIKRGWK